MQISRGLQNWLFIIGYCVLFFIGTYGLAIAWNTRGYFEYYDIFFDTDPSANLNSFVKGWYGGRNAISHPLIELLSVLVRFLAIPIQIIGLIPPGFKAREIVALGISPLFSTLTILVFYQLVGLFGFLVDRKVGFTLLFSLAFSNLLFAIVPETYSISGLFVCLLLFYYFYCQQKNIKGHFLVWLLLGVALAGTTISNIGILVVVYFLNLYRSKIHSTKIIILKSISIMIMGLVIVIGFYYTNNYIREIGPKHEGSYAWVVSNSSDSLQKVKKNIHYPTCRMSLSG